VPEPYRILQVHNRYSSGWGGEDTVADLEAALLCERGHNVERLLISTAPLKTSGMVRQIAAIPSMLWSRQGYRAVRERITKFSPDVVHVHNTFPIFSSSIFWAAHAKVPVVQTLHNFRYICAGSLLWRNERPCGDCLDRFPWSALRHRCYGNSFGRTGILTLMNGVHSRIGTLTKKVDVFIALNDFSKEMFVRAGLPAEKIAVKPNFVPAPSSIASPRLAQILFVGSIIRHKGLHLLLEAWKQITAEGTRLLVIGDGPDRASLQNRYRDLHTVIWCGPKNRQEIMKSLAESRALVMPSLCYENCPMALLEALSVGTPVLAPDHGGIPGFVPRELKELMFEPGDLGSLIAKIRMLLDAGENVWKSWSQFALSAYVQRFSSACNYKALIQIYDKAIQGFAAARNDQTIRKQQSLTQH
jgi:glycosyltransferase involved in cell wall biosynthesis